MEQSIQFFSKSKNLHARHLSNFTQCQIVIPDTFMYPKMKGYTFNSIENAFQACKYVLCDRMDIVKKITKLSPSEAKSLGSKIGMKKEKCTLNIQKWNMDSYYIMKQLVKIRYETDELFRKIIDSGKEFKHFERSGEKSYWGGCYKNNVWEGNNALGKIFMNLSNDNNYQNS